MSCRSATCPIHGQKSPFNLCEHGLHVFAMHRHAGLWMPLMLLAAGVVPLGDGLRIHVHSVWHVPASFACYVKYAHLRQ